MGIEVAPIVAPAAVARDTEPPAAVRVPAMHSEKGESSLRRRARARQTGQERGLAEYVDLSRLHQRTLASVDDRDACAI